MSGKTMKAARIAAYGGPEVVRVEEVARPVPGVGEVLVRVEAAPVTSGDMRMRSGKVPRGFGVALRLAMGWSRPRNPPGWSFAGEVAALGEGATGLTVGEKVWGIAGFKGGTHAEYLALPADGAILPRPAGLTAAEAAGLIFGATAAVHFLIDKAALRAGESILVNGATGAVGTAAMMIARHLGARVTAIASASSRERAMALGAEAFQDWRAGPPQGRFDVVMDVVGTLPFARARALLVPGGRHLGVTATLGQTLLATLRPRVGGLKRIAGVAPDTRAILARVADLVQAGALGPLGGTVLPLAEIARAHALAETMHKPGAVVVTMGGPVP